MTQILDSAPRPPLRRRIPVHCAITAARLLARLSPRRIRAILEALRRGANAATYEQALAARADVVASSVHCAGKYCLPRALATTLLCRMRGVWPTWCTEGAYFAVRRSCLGRGSQSTGGGTDRDRLLPTHSHRPAIAMTPDTYPILARALAAASDD
jgi:Transglutaminase-like superfamily